MLLPHDWLTWRLRQTADARLPVTAATTDRGDASGTGYFSPRAGRWLADVAAEAIGHGLDLPQVAEPAAVIGRTGAGAVLSAGTGDNMAAALGLGLRPGDVVISIGTSGTAFADSARPAADPSGAVAGFANATGQYLPLVCTINAAGVLTATAALLSCSLADLSARALAAESGAGGLTMLPYLDGERTPDRPRASGVLSGLTTANASGENLARAAVEAVLASLADAAGLLAGRRVLPACAADWRRIEVRGHPAARARRLRHPDAGAGRPSTWHSGPLVRRHGLWLARPSPRPGPRCRRRNTPGRPAANPTPAPGVAGRHRRVGGQRALTNLAGAGAHTRGNSSNQLCDHGADGLLVCGRAGSAISLARAPGFGYTAQARPQRRGRDDPVAPHGVWGNWQPDGFWPR